MGTGIYRANMFNGLEIDCVPCGYRDIPAVANGSFALWLRSLWVQGYTGLECRPIYLQLAFPVGTGIYRGLLTLSRNCSRVPCGYRDIPERLDIRNYHLGRSLWVQGYTGTEKQVNWAIEAFPVGTGIYRRSKSNTTN